MKIKENTNIVQANYLIENRPKFTKDETRLYLTIIGAINKDDLDFTPLEIPVSEFAALWGMDISAAYRKIKTALRGLVQKEFFIEGVNPKTGKLRFLSASYLSMASYEEGQGYATVEISQAFKPHLLALKEKYTQYVLANILNLSTVNAIRNYELLKQYESLGFRVFTVEEYKEALKIEDKYSLNADLRRYVLEPAVKEINQNTDLSVTYEITGRGRKTKIKFTISQRKRLEPLHLSEKKVTEENQATISNSYEEDNDYQTEVDRDKRDAICSGFADEIFDEFTNEELTQLRALAWDVVPQEDVEREVELLDNMLLAKEYAASQYIKQKIILSNTKSELNTKARRFGFIKKAIINDWI